MDQVIEFSTNHWPLVLSFAVLLALALNMEFKRSGAALSTHQVTAKINAEDACVLDIRETKDFNAGHIVGSIHVPLVKLESELKNLEKYKNKSVIVVCNMGQTSGQAVRKLEEAGFEQASRMSGGISAWRAENLPLVKS
jgi:rhodanese-related sulfurtransferase